MPGTDTHTHTLVRSLYTSHVNRKATATVQSHIFGINDQDKKEWMTVDNVGLDESTITIIIVPAFSISTGTFFLPCEASQGKARQGRANRGKLKRIQQHKKEIFSKHLSLKCLMMIKFRHRREAELMQ